MISLKITLEKIKSAFERSAGSDLKAKVEFESYLNALNDYYSADNRFGQPVHAALADDFAQYFEPSSIAANAVRPRFKPEFRESLGTIVRDHLGIPFKSGQSVVLLAYKVDTLLKEFQTQPLSIVKLDRPCIIDVDINNEWFSPSPKQYGRCGQTVNVTLLAPYTSSCELIHPQLPAQLEQCIWIGEITGNFPDNPEDFKKRHRAHVTMCKCQRATGVCSNAAGCSLGTDFNI